MPLLLCADVGLPILLISKDMEEYECQGAGDVSKNLFYHLE